MDKYTDHPIAELFPLMSESELQELADDIRDNGQREDIIVYQARIIDGRNRYRACLLADVEPRVRSYIGTDPIRDVLSWNLHRRHLTTSQRAMVATAVLPMLEEQARERMHEAGKAAGRGRPKQAEKGSANLHTPNDSEEEHRSASDAATMLNVSPRSVATAKKVAAAAPELAEKVKAGEVSLNAAAQEVKRAETAQKRETKPIHDFRVLAIHPDWTADYAALRRMEFPETDNDFHALVVVPCERMNDGLYLFHSWFGVYPSLAFPVLRGDTEMVDGVRVQTDLVYYAPIGAPEWNTAPDTMQMPNHATLWKFIKHSTDGPHYAVGFDAGGWKHDK